MHSARVMRWALALVVIPMLAQGVTAQEGPWALTNARIETVTRGVIEKGTIVIRDGLIESVGANVRPPADARIVDLAGRTVFPGLIDLTSTLGLSSASAGGDGQRQGGAPGAATAASTVRNVGLEPGRIVANELRPSAADIRGARDAGITAVLVAPSRGAFRGLSALVPLRDESATQYVVKSPVALHMGFEGVQGSGGSRPYPATLLGVIAYERQRLYDARHHAQLQERYRAGGRGVPRPSYDADLDALIPVVSGSLPAFFDADRENEIRRAVRIGDEFDLKLGIVGATEGFRAIDALKRAEAVVVSLDFPRPTSVTGWSYRSSQRHALDDSAATDSAVQRTLHGNAATLHQAGVRFALSSGGLRPAEFMGNVRKAIAAGLPRDIALQALTIRPAEIAGVGAQLGSIEAGKIANLVVAERDILGDSARVRMVFVDGIRHEVIAPAAAERRRGGAAGGGERAAGGEMARVAGAWALTVTHQGQDHAATLTATQTGATLDGTVATELGTVQITDARVTGQRVTFTITLPIEGQTTVIVFRGTVDGNRMSGDVDLGALGAGTFTGERQP